MCIKMLYICWLGKQDTENEAMHFQVKCQPKYVNFPQFVEIAELMIGQHWSSDLMDRNLDSES